MNRPEFQRRAVVRHAFAIGAATALALVSGGAHAGYNVFTDQYTIDQADLLAQIQTRFPLSVGTPGWFDCVLSQPGLVLEPAVNRLKLTLDARISTPLLERPVMGALAVSSALRFDAQALAVRLDRPRAERIALESVTGEDAARLQEVGAALAAEALRDYPIHAFKPADMQVGYRRLTIASITVTGAGLTVQLS